MTGFVHMRQFWLYVLVFLAAVGLTVGIAALLFNINQRKLEAVQHPARVVEIAEDEIDPAVWGQNFPLQYESFQQTAVDYGRTPYGGGTRYSKLEQNPRLVRLWAGYPFGKDHNEERGHHYALIDQIETRRVTDYPQPGACANCHAAEAPQLIEEMGWDEFNSAVYLELAENLHTGTSCSDCHDPETMALRITRPAFRNAMAERGIDVDAASRQEMRTYVCAQCHVEYYFAGEKKNLTFPWINGTSIDEIADYYAENGHIDFTHAETGGGLLKAQHPEFELYTTSLHYRSGVACADCHMPYVREGSTKVSDHWLRSPLTNVGQSCQTCHNFSEEHLTERITVIQNKTAELLTQSEEAILAAVDAIVSAKAAGVSDEQLAEAMELHRFAQLRWDFVSSENSTGFHSPQEAARILADSIDMARQAELAAVRSMSGTQTANLDIATE